MKILKNKGNNSERSRNASLNFFKRNKNEKNGNNIYKILLEIIMIVLLIILSILFIIFSLFLVLCLSTLQIEVKNLEINSKNELGKKAQNYIIYIKLKLLNKLTWIKIKIDKTRVNKIKKSRIFNEKIFRKFKNIQRKLIINKKIILKKENLKFVKQINIEFEQLKMNLDIGLIDSTITALSVAFIASIISVVLAKTAVHRNGKNNYKYLITPSYGIEPIINIKLNCIINIKTVHIINAIYMLIKKRSVKNDERTSNRRSYDRSNEEHSRYG